MTEILTVPMLALELSTTPDALRARIRRSAEFARHFAKLGARCFITRRECVPEIAKLMRGKRAVEACDPA